MKKTKENIKGGSSGGDAVYFFGLLGSLVYYVGSVDGFWNIILAILKAFVWPAFVIYDLLKFLG